MHETVPGINIAPVIIFGMDEAGRAVADSLEANGIAYDAIDADYERLLSASADGYPVAFGDPADPRLMATLDYAERKAIVITVIRAEEVDAMKLVMHDRYPELTCFVAADSEADRACFESIGLRAVINRSMPRGLDLAVAVLRHQQVDEQAIQLWMRRYQERSLQAAVAAATLVTD